ncbi:efflux RND transporter permease subunit [Blastomonas aquatica]|nr:MMPL family transporter [Blastomonas aquatica]
MDRIACVIVARAHWLAAFGLVLALLLAGGLGRLSLDNSQRAFFPQGDEIIERTDWLAERMGNGKDAMILIYVPAEADVLSPFSLSQLRTVADEARALPYVIDTSSFFDAQKLAVVPESGSARDRLVALPFLQGADLFSDAGLAALKRDLVAAPTVLGRSLGRDFKSAAITLQVELDNPGEDDGLTRRERIDALKTAVDRLEAVVVEAEPGARVMLVGSGLFEHVSTEVLKYDVRRLFPMFGAFFVLTLLACYRSILFAAGSAVLIGLVVAATAGTMAWAGVSLSTVSVSGLLLVGTLAVADIIHIANGYFLNRSAPSNAAALEAAIRAYFLPVLATSLTTALGAAAMFMTPARPIAILAAVILVGVGLALLLTLMLLPAMLLACPRQDLPIHDRIVAGILRASRAARARRAWSLGVTGVVTIAAIFGIAQLVVNDDLAGWFDESTEFRQGMDLLDTQYLSLRTITLAVQVKDADRDALLNANDRIDPGYFGDLQRRLSAGTEGDWLSVVTAQQSWRVRLAERSEPNGFRPDPAMLSPDLGKPSSSVLADSGLLTQLEPGVADWSVSYFDATDPTTFGLLEQATRIEDLATAQGDAARAPSLQGVPYAFARTSAANFVGISIGSLGAMALVTLSMLLVFRSLGLALIAIIPNILPLLITYGAWGAVSGQLNMAAVGVFSIAYGIVVDDTIHLIIAYRNRRRAGLNHAEAIDKAIVSSGSAVLVTTVLLSCGFLLLSLSDFNLTAQKAGMTGCAIITALAFDLLVLPILLQWSGKRTQRMGGNGGEAQFQ